MFRHIRPSRKVAAIDVEEVLFPFMIPFLKWSRFKPNKERYPYSISHLMNTTEFYTQRKITNFVHSVDFEMINPVKNSSHGLAYLREHGFKIYAVSGGHKSTRDQVENMIESHFPYLVDDLLFSNTFSSENVPKLKLYHAVGADLIVNDNLDTCKKSIGDGIEAVNFIGDPVYPWCEESPHSANTWTDLVLKVKSST